jgi:hypothetical protein
MAEIVELRPAGDGNDQVFNCVCDMEGDLRASRCARPCQRDDGRVPTRERHQSASLGNQASRPERRETAGRSLSPSLGSHIQTDPNNGSKQEEVTRTRAHHFHNRRLSREAILSGLRQSSFLAALMIAVSQRGNEVCK